MKKEIRNMLKTSINITLNAIDEKAANKIARSVDKAAERITKKFVKNLKLKGKHKEEIKGLLHKDNALAPVEATSQS